MTKIMLMVFFVFSACSITKYTLPPNVYRSSISPSSTSLDYATLSLLNRDFVKNKRLLIVAVSYDQYENVSVPSISQAMMKSMKELTNNMQESLFFKDVQFTTMSHFKIGTISELLGISKHFGADYILLINTAYNFYKYSTTWGNFIAWVPIINFMVPFNRFTGTIFVEGTLLAGNGAILFTESVNHQVSENTNILYSREHFLRMSGELHQKAYKKLVTRMLNDMKGKNRE